MLPNNEYVALLKYAICLHINISMFPTVWDVLSILLNTQDGNLEYVKFLQEEYNRYYEYRTRKYVEKLEKKSIAIQTHMYDSVAHDFDRVSDYCDNGSTPLQGQQDEQPEAVNGAEIAIELDAIDILTSTLHGQQRHMTHVIMMTLFMIEIEKRYKLNYLKTHLLKLKTISPI